MHQLNLTENSNGMLFLDNFGIIQQCDLSLSVSMRVEVLLKNKSLGIAEIMAIKNIKYLSLRDEKSYLYTGKPAVYLAATLSKQFLSNKNKNLDDREFQEVILQYRQRNFENQELLWKDWWYSKTNP